MIPRQLHRSLKLSALVHGLVAAVFVLNSYFSWGLNDQSMEVTWVEIPRGMSDEIETGLRKSADLPKTTIEQQKQSAQELAKKFTPSAPLPKTAKTNPEVMKKPGGKEKQQKKPLSAIDQKIQAALKANDKKVAASSAPPEAAQIKESGEGYKFGTGNQALRTPPTDPEYIKYQSEVRSKIIGEWIVPPAYAGDEEIHFKAQIAVSINEQGEVTNTSWVNHSGNAAFDASVIRAIVRAAPLPKPPQALEWEVYNEGLLLEFDPHLKMQ